MQPDTERKKAMMDELKHYINGKFEELKKELFNSKAEVSKPKKVEREKATRG